MNPVIAMLDMRGNVVAGVIVVMFGAALVQTFRTPGSDRRRRRWIVHVAFWSGPAISMLWCLIDGIESQDYLYPGFVAEVAMPMLIIGGAIGATGFWIAESAFQGKS